MTLLPWLAPGEPFPPTASALDEPNGLLAAGGDLSVDTLLRAYRQGIFPWYQDGEPLLWWSPAPRTVLWPDAFHWSHSLRRSLRRHHWQITLNRCFSEVMHQCAISRRPGQAGGSWITGEMKQAYQALHRTGHALSVEVWQHQQLVGGLYGVRLGAMFFGESMFSLVSDASKAALGWLCDQHQALGIRLIDCQMQTSHLVSLGARQMSRRRFERCLRHAVAAPGNP